MQCTNHIEEEPVRAMHVDCAPAPAAEAAVASSNQRGAEKKTKAHGVTKRTIRKAAKKAARGARIYGSVASDAPVAAQPADDDVAARGAGLDSAIPDSPAAQQADGDKEVDPEPSPTPWKGPVVSNRFQILASPDAPTPRPVAEPVAQSPAQPLAVLEIAPVVAVAPSNTPVVVEAPASPVATKKKQVSFSPTNKENRVASTPIARRTRAAAKMIEQVVAAVVDAVSPGLKRSSRAAAACMPMSRLSNLA